jgi:hypothetical protein
LLTGLVCASSSKNSFAFLSAPEMSLGSRVSAGNFIFAGSLQESIAAERRFRVAAFL